MDRDGARIMAGICRGTLCVHDAECETRRTGLETRSDTPASGCRNKLRLIQLRESLVEAPDACVVEVSRPVEPHHDGTGVLLLRHPRRILRGIGKVGTDE